MQLLIKEQAEFLILFLMINMKVFQLARWPSVGSGEVLLSGDYFDGRLELINWIEKRQELFTENQDVEQLKIAS